MKRESKTEKIERELIENYGWTPSDIEGYEDEGMTHEDMLSMAKDCIDEPQRKTKGILIEGKVNVIRLGSSCVGCMAWETPYAIIEHEGNEYIWQSDRVEIMRICKGEYNIRAFAYGDRLRKVRVNR